MKEHARRFDSPSRTPSISNGVNLNISPFKHFTVQVVPSPLGSGHGFSATGGQTLQWLRGGLVFEAHKLLYHSAYGSRTV